MYQYKRVFPERMMYVTTCKGAQDNVVMLPMKTRDVKRKRRRTTTLPMIKAGSVWSLAAHPSLGTTRRGHLQSRLLASRGVGIRCTLS